MGFVRKVCKRFARGNGCSIKVGNNNVVGFSIFYQQLRGYLHSVLENHAVPSV